MHQLVSKIIDPTYFLYVEFYLQGDEMPKKPKFTKWFNRALKSKAQETQSPIAQTAKTNSDYQKIIEKPESNYQTLVERIVATTNDASSADLDLQAGTPSQPSVNEGSSNITVEEWKQAKKLIAERTDRQRQALGEMMEPGFNVDEAPYGFEVKGSNHSFLTYEGKVYCIAGGHVGQGAFGSVMMGFAEDGAKIVIKTQQSSPQLDPRIENEFELTRRAGLHLGDIAKMNGQGSLDNFQIMPYKGTSLKELLASNSLNEDERKEIGLKTLEEVKKLHDLNMVHRDLHSGNILVERKPDGSFGVTVVDFGLSKVLKNGEIGIKPIAGEKHNFSIIAPEIAIKDPKTGKLKSIGGSFSKQSDIYALGILFEKLGLDSSMIERMKAADPNKRGSLDEAIESMKKLGDSNLTMIGKKEAVAVPAPSEKVTAQSYKDIQEPSLAPEPKPKPHIHKRAHHVSFSKAHVVAGSLKDGASKSSGASAMSKTQGDEPDKKRGTKKT